MSATRRLSFSVRVLLGLGGALDAEQLERLHLLRPRQPLVGGVDGLLRHRPGLGLWRRRVVNSRPICSAISGADLAVEVRIATTYGRASPIAMAWPMTGIP